MKKFIFSMLIMALVAITPATPARTASGATPGRQDSGAATGPSITFNNVYQTLGECRGLPRVSGVLETCGRTLIIKAGGTP